MNGSISTKVVSMAKMISWKKLQADEEDSADRNDQTSTSTREEEVWRKTIMRGERCRPLDFSGKIVYDSQGNLLQESPH
ncbi:hypothetical protein L484_027216 [Morus notabilis]|uniref:Uncharacterized protein n=1 Tax=Morus notabilis TaxID=981085 RepID=W9SBT6_9ROSA|nr:hypothetical protein L484_027216 [Morus notabilis]